MNRTIIKSINRYEYSQVDQVLEASARDSQDRVDHPSVDIIWKNKCLPRM